MTKTIRIGAAGIAMFAALGMSSVSHAQTQATAEARAEVLAALELTVDGQLDFGRIIVDAAGTAALPASGTMTCSAGLLCLDAGTVPTFTVDGTDGRDVTVSFPGGTTVELNNGGADPLDSMDVTGLAPSESTVTLTTGEDTFTVGGTLNVSDGQNPGQYTGTFAVQVDYS
jgi:hypothetical protein